MSNENDEGYVLLERMVKAEIGRQHRALVSENKRLKKENERLDREVGRIEAGLEERYSEVAETIARLRAASYSLRSECADLKKLLKKPVGQLVCGDDSYWARVSLDEADRILASETKKLNSNRKAIGWVTDDD